MIEYDTGKPVALLDILLLLNGVFHKKGMSSNELRDLLDILLLLNGVFHEALTHKELPLVVILIFFYSLTEFSTSSSSSGQGGMDGA